MRTNTVPLPFFHRPNPIPENSGTVFDPSYGQFFSMCEIDNSRAMVFSSYVKQRIVFFRAKGYKAPTIKCSKRTELIMYEIGSVRAGHRQG